MEDNGRKLLVNPLCDQPNREVEARAQAKSSSSDEVLFPWCFCASKVLGEGVTRGFPIFSGKIMSMSQNISALFLVGPFGKQRKRQTTHRENPRNWGKTKKQQQNTLTKSTCIVSGFSGGLCLCVLYLLHRE